MIPKYYTCIVVSRVKAPLIELTLLSFLHAVAFMQWGENLISLTSNLDDMPPFYQGIYCIPHGMLIKHPFSFISSSQRILNLIFQLILIDKHQWIDKYNDMVTCVKPQVIRCLTMPDPPSMGWEESAYWRDTLIAHILGKHLPKRDMCPAMGDHMVAILVLNAQRCHHRASVLQGRGWKDVLYPQFPCDYQFFYPFK